MDDATLVGVVLLGVIPFVVWDGISSVRAGFDNAFWMRPLEEKMTAIVAVRDAWHRIGIVWIFVSGLLAAGFTAFSFQLVSAGEPVLAALGLGAFLLTAIGFTWAALLMVSTISRAAEVHAESGDVPPWALPAWTSTWWIERAFIIGANLAYIAWGAAIVSSGYPATWAGWVAIVSGAVLVAWVSLREYFFQHLVLITPIAIGMALLVA